LILHGLTLFVISGTLLLTNTVTSSTQGRLNAIFYYNKEKKTTEEPQTQKAGDFLNFPHSFPDVLELSKVDFFCSKELKIICV
jgi:hypothetical protein